MTAPTSSLQPIYNLAILYKQGMKISVASNTTLSITSGVCRDSANAIDINIGDFFGAQTATTVNIATTGLNALDTGTVAASKVYAVWAIADVAHYNPSGFLLSLSLTAPVVPKGVFPSGYGNIRLIGFAVTDASSHFLTIHCSGLGNTVVYTYDAPVLASNDFATATQTAISVAALVPAIEQIPMSLGVDFTPAAASRKITLCTSGGTIASSTDIIMGQVAAVHVWDTKVINAALISGVPKFDAVVSNADSPADIYVNSFTHFVS